MVWWLVLVLSLTSPPCWALSVQRLHTGNPLTSSVTFKGDKLGFWRQKLFPQPKDFFHLEQTYFPFVGLTPTRAASKLALHTTPLQSFCWWSGGLRIRTL